MGSRIVIVGGGPAGCVLARSLSEDATREVLLLEAGRAFPPGGFPETLKDADRLGSGIEFDWGYTSEPGRLGFAIAAQSGKVLGGGSSINAGVAKRARASDFARWSAHSLPGWDFDHVLAAYKALENTPDGSVEWHGRSGPFPVRQPRMANVTGALRAFVSAAIGTGFDQIDDFNGAVQHGVGVDPFNVINGVRQNASMAYLTTAVRARPNLVIRGESQVDRVEIADRRAVGVRLVTGQIIGADAVIL